ncbi:MAG: Zn-ribbon domain-containing OB-fold protein [Candidatus Thorarchaeota archaeon]
MTGNAITGSRCRSCERTIVPPRETCPYCGKRAGPMERLDLPPIGSVQSYTTLQNPRKGFNAPLSMALVKLRNGALILCLAEEDVRPIKIGDQVEIGLDSENRFIYRTAT